MSFSPGFAGRCPQRLRVFQHNLFNLHTFRPWLYCLIWGEMPLFHIGSMSWNTRFMAHLSELGLKTGTRAVTVRHRARRRRGGTACRHMVGISALFFRRNHLSAIANGDGGMIIATAVYRIYT